MRSLWRSLYLTVGVLAGIGLAGAALAQPTAVTADDLEREKWQEMYREVVSEHAMAKEELAKAEFAYTNMQQRSYPRGEARLALVARFEDAKKRLASAEEALAEFPETARRAGALPGWFRDPE